MSFSLDILLPIFTLFVYVVYLDSGYEEKLSVVLLKQLRIL